ncbi:MAG: hypothetical protein GX638_04040, partial [Crenarchaeota archaeon]|nr:hypothetical protein [Thermoproteota archaeon]
MSASAKLQKAIEITIAAGYQIDKEAFEFLSAISSDKDPSELVSKALEKINLIEEKPLFINRNFLESLLSKPKQDEEEKITAPSSIGVETLTHQTSTESLEESFEQEDFENLAPFDPYAKHIEPEIEVLMDCTESLTSNGTIEEFLQYFQDRFKRLEKLLRQR